MTPYCDKHPPFGTFSAWITPTRDHHDRGSRLHAVTHVTCANHSMSTNYSCRTDNNGYCLAREI